MITVQKFCWCCRLEIGGLVIGALNSILSLLGFLCAVYACIESYTRDCSGERGYPQDIRVAACTYFVLNNISSLYKFECCRAPDSVCFCVTCMFIILVYPGSYLHYYCTSSRRVSIGRNVILMVLFGGIAYTSFICIQGTKARNHKRVMPMLILLFAALVLSALPICFIILGVLRHGDDFLIMIGIGLGFASGIALYIYFFVVVYSLYSLFRREHRAGGPNPNYYQVQYAENV